MKRPRSAKPIESLESRLLFDTAAPWSDAMKVVSQDVATANYPTVTGQGVTVAILDTGVDYNNPLMGGGFGPGHKVKAGFDFVDNDSDPMDPEGHGTANAALLAANPYDTGGLHYQGVAPGASLVALRVADVNDNASFVNIDKALKWIEDNYESLGISIISFSYGSGQFTTDQTNPTISPDLKILADDGLFFISPSGNAGGNGVMYPAADPNVFAVGGVGTTDAISSFTQRGPLLDILAPAEDLKTLSLNNTFTTVSNGSYCVPIAAGAAALIKQVDPTANRNDMMSILQASGVAHTDAGQTYSRLDLYNAITMAMRRAPDPTTDVGRNGAANDMAYDKNGVLNFAYYDQTAHTIKFATRDTAGEWSATQVVDPSGNDVGATMSLAVDHLGRPAIAYYDATNGDLDYARFDGTAWHRSALDTKNIVGQFASLAFDSNNNPVVAYYRKTSGDLRVMRFDGTNWQRDQVDTGGDVGQFASLAIDSNNNIGVAYADTTNGALKYASYNGSSWTTSTVDDLLGTAAFISLAFDHSNAPAISYYDAYPADLKYATKSSGNWVATPIVRKGAVGLFTNLWFDDAGDPNIVYYSRKSNALFHVHGPIGSLTADTLTLAGGVNAAVAPTADGSAATFSWWNPLKKKIYTGDLT